MTSISLSYARADDVDPFNPAMSFVARLHRDRSMPTRRSPRSCGRITGSRYMKHGCSTLRQ